MASAATGRSLNLPASSYPPGQSALDASYLQSELDAYTQHPAATTLDQIMLHYLGMEEILKLYQQNYKQFETRQTLNTLALRFQLPAATTFKQLLRAYDMQYATVRSYLYDNRTPKQLLYQAALEGDIQAFYNQLKLYPKLRAKDVYTLALEKAAEGGHRAIMDLLLDLGAASYAILNGAAKGGHVAIVKEELATYKGVKTLKLVDLAYISAANNRLAVLAYILSVSTARKVIAGALEGAGESANIDMIEYLIAKGYDLTVVLQGAARAGQLEIIEQYYSKIEPRMFKDVLEAAIDTLRLDIVKYLFEKGDMEVYVSKEVLIRLKSANDYCLMQLEEPANLLSSQRIELTRKIDGTQAIIDYLELQGITSE